MNFWSSLILPCTRYISTELWIDCSIWCNILLMFSAVTSDEYLNDFCVGILILLILLIVDTFFYWCALHLKFNCNEYQQPKYHHQDFYFLCSLLCIWKITLAIPFKAFHTSFATWLCTNIILNDIFVNYMDFVTINHELIYCQVMFPTSDKSKSVLERFGSG